MVSGNASDGIYLSDSGTTNNVLEYNAIGTNVQGYALGNGEYGVILVSGTADNTLYANTMEYSGADGLATFGAGGGNIYSYNTVINNYGGNILWD